MMEQCKENETMRNYKITVAKVTSPTETGKLLYKFADRFYVQWESMLKFYPKAKYLGGIY